MSWDLTIRSSGGSLGSLEAVRQTIARIFPAARFDSEPSGIEKVRAAEAQGIQFPSIIRGSMLARPARYSAELQEANVSVSLFFGAVDIVREIGVEVRGSGDPFPLLRRIVAVDGWQIIDDSTGRLLTPDSPPRGTGWEIYRKMLVRIRNDSA